MKKRNKPVMVRIRQADLAIAALEELAKTTFGWLATGELIRRLRVRMKPVFQDTLPYPSQSNPRFNQIVRNLVSNRKMRRSMFRLGYAKYSSLGAVVITPEGREFLKTVPR